MIIVHYNYSSWLSYSNSFKMNESFLESTCSFRSLNEPNDTKKWFVHFDERVWTIVDCSNRRVTNARHRTEQMRAFEPIKLKLCFVFLNEMENSPLYGENLYGENPGMFSSKTLISFRLKKEWHGHPDMGVSKL